NNPALLDAAVLPWGRCPSDDGDPNNGARRGCNYVGSLGPQCVPSNGYCGDTDTYDQYCNQPTWGYSTSPEHGNSYNAADIRGVFNRVGAKFRFPASIPDGTSN